MLQRRAVRVLVAGACGVLGVAVAVCAVLLHGYLWGLALALATTAAVLVALPGGPPRLCFAAGWVLVLAVLTPTRTEGDYLVAGDVSGYALLISGLLVFAAGFVGLVKRPVPSRDSGPLDPAP